MFEHPGLILLARDTGEGNFVEEQMLLQDPEGEMTCESRQERQGQAKGPAEFLGERLYPAEDIALPSVQLTTY